MSFCSQQILALANNIYQTIGCPSDKSVAFISGYLTNSGSLGDLNSKLSTCFYFTGDSPCIVGGFGGSEASIYSQIYISEYYEHKAANVLAGGGILWTSIAEGDTKITRSDMVNVAKTYIALQDSARKDLRLAIQDYKRLMSIPQSVDYSSLPSYPSP